MQPTFTTENPVAGQGNRHCLLRWPIRAKKYDSDDCASAQFL